MSYERSSVSPVNPASFSETKQTPAGRQSSPPSLADASRSIRILAKTVYKELRVNGHSDADVVAFANAVLDLMSNDMTKPDEFDAS